eukprot:5411838-Amphidinium_carterae.1
MRQTEEIIDGQNRDAVQPHPHLLHDEPSLHILRKKFALQVARVPDVADDEQDNNACHEEEEMFSTRRTGETSIKRWA